MPYPLFCARQTQTTLEVSGPHQVELGYRIGEGRSANGVFARWRFEAAESRLVAEVDRHGMYPLYYHATPQRLLVSPSTLALIAHGAPADLDPSAVSLLLHNGFLFGQDTPFAHIRAMPPGGTLTWLPGAQPRLESPGEAVWPEQRATRTEAVDGFVALFRQAVSRLAPLLTGGQAVLPLSGGRDSRHILLEMLAQGTRPRYCVTYNYTRGGQDPETRIAAQLASAAGVRHVVLPAGTSPAAATIRAFGLTHCCSDEGFQALPMRDHCVAARVGVLLDGLAGDVLSRNRSGGRPQHRQLIDNRDWPALARLMLEGHAGKSAGEAGSVESLLSADQRRRYPREMAVEAFVGRLARYADAADPYAAFIFWNRTRREIALSPYGLLSAVPQVVSPFLDQDLVSFLGGLPVSTTFDAPLHDQVIATAYPAFAQIAYGGGGSPTTRRSILRPALSVASGLAAMLRVDPAGLGRELLAHARSPLLGASRKLARYRYYVTLLERLQDRAVAVRYLELLEETDRRASRVGEPA